MIWARHSALSLRLREFVQIHCELKKEDAVGDTEKGRGYTTIHTYRLTHRQAISYS